MKRKVLCIDDENSWRMMVSMFLKLAGYECIAVKDAINSMLYSSEDDLAAIVMDVNLPGENTGALLKSLKDANPGVPIILYSGLDETAPEIKRLLVAGANQHLRKGNLQDLVQCVRVVADRSSDRVEKPAMLQTSAWQIV
jgi:DNA-binding response OmpR family regulator